MKTSKLLKIFNNVVVFYSEIPNDAGDSTAHNGKPAEVKEEEKEEEASEQPAAKKKRGSKSQTKTPKEEIKSEGNAVINFIFLSVIPSETSPALVYGLSLVF